MFLETQALRLVSPRSIFRRYPYEFGLTGLSKLHATQQKFDCSKVRVWFMMKVYVQAVFFTS